MAAAAADRPVVEVRGTGDLADGTYTFTQIVNGGRAFKHTAKPLAIHVYNIEIARRNDRYWLLGECVSASGYGISKILYYCPIKDRTVVAEGGLPPSEGWEVCTREKSIRGGGEGNPPLVRSGQTVEEAVAAMAGAGVMLGLGCALVRPPNPSRSPLPRKRHLRAFPTPSFAFSKAHDPLHTQSQNADSPYRTQPILSRAVGTSCRRYSGGNCQHLACECDPGRTAP